MTGERLLGPWMATALVIGGTIGSGVPAARYAGPIWRGPAARLGHQPYGALLLAFDLRLPAHKIPHRRPLCPRSPRLRSAARFIVAWSYWISIQVASPRCPLRLPAALARYFRIDCHALRSAACALAALWICVGANLAGNPQQGRLRSWSPIAEAAAAAAVRPGRWLMWT